MPAGLLSSHHDVPGACGIEIRSRLIDNACRVGVEQARNEALPEQTGRRVAAVREAVADDGFAVALDVGDDRRRRTPSSV
ncbi:MAG: hypothetical protein R2849_20155 [Thermomicrobiales bacterium]